MRVHTQRRRFETEGEITGTVTGVVHRPSRARRPAFLLAPGADEDLDEPGLVSLCDAIAGRGHLVVRANLPYREAGAPRPRADRAVSGHVALANAARELAPRTPWVVGGKAYGARVASLAVANDELDAAGMLLYSYPLHPRGRPDRLRVDHWPDIPVPCLFLRGDQDARCDRSLLEQNLRRLPRRARVHVVEGGDEALAVTRDHAPDGTSRPAPAITGELGALVESWLQETIG